MTRKKILVLDGRSLASLAIARSLGSKGLEIHCGDSFKSNLTSYSKYVKKQFIYPDPKNDKNEFVEWVLNTVKENDYDLVLPVRDDTTLLLAKYQEEISEYTNLYLSDFNTVKKLNDKAETVKVAQKNDIPTPRTWFPEETPVEEIKEEIKYPILIRPRTGSGSRGIKYVKEPRGFDDAYDSVSQNFGMPMVQEFVEQEEYMTTCLLLDDDQKSIGEFSYRRTKEFPVSGGPTVVGISTEETTAKSSAKKLLEKVSWKGPAEVEFVVDETGIPKILEVNPRFWMPLQLAIKSGVDFPYLIYRLSQDEEIESVNTYETGIKYRWVLPNEFLWFLNSQDKISGIKELLQNFWEKDVCYGTLSRVDPLPIMGTIAQSMSFMLKKEKRKQVLDRGW